MKRFATANWNGSGKEGNGTLTTQSTAIQNAQYSFNSRFAEGVGTNPEELVAAAHAGCFSMKLAFVCGAGNVTPERIDTKCTITLEDGAITSSHLDVSVKANITAEQLETFVADAKANCPISKLYNTNITATAVLA